MSAGDPRHSAVEQDDGDVQVGIAPHLAEFGSLGTLMVFHADGIRIGLIEVDDRAPRISVLVAKASCDCGCNKRGHALLVTPTSYHAREMAAKLIEQADTIDAAAHAQAADFIGKVRKL